MLISFVNINPECEQLIKISVHGSPPRVRPFTSNPRTRGSQILIARLSTRNHNRIFSRCHYFARSDEMNLATLEETKWQDSKAKANQPANRTPSSTGPPPDNFDISDEAKQKFTVAQGRDCRSTVDTNSGANVYTTRISHNSLRSNRTDLRFTVPLNHLFRPIGPHDGVCPITLDTSPRSPLALCYRGCCTTGAFHRCPAFP